MGSKGLRHGAPLRESFREAPEEWEWVPGRSEREKGETGDCLAWEKWE